MKKISKVFLFLLLVSSPFKIHGFAEEQNADDLIDSTPVQDVPNVPEPNESDNYTETPGDTVEPITESPIVTTEGESMSENVNTSINEIPLGPDGKPVEIPTTQIETTVVIPVTTTEPTKPVIINPVIAPPRSNNFGTNYTIPDINRTPTRPVQITSSGNTINNDEETPVDIEAIMKNSMENPLFYEAFEDLNKLKNELSFNDESEDQLLGSLYEDVLKRSENYMSDNKKNVKQEIITIDDAIIVKYLYFSSGDQNQETPLSELVYYFEYKQLSAMSVTSLSGLPNDSTDIEMLQSINKPDSTGKDLTELSLKYIGLIHKKNNHQEYNVLITTSGEGENRTYELIEISPTFVTNEVSVLVKEKPNLSELVQQFVLERSIQIIQEQPVEVDNINQEEKTETTEEIAFEDTILNPSEYEKEKLIPVKDMEQIYDTINEKILNQEEISLSIIYNQIKNPTKEQKVGENSYYSYYGLEKDKVYLMDILENFETKEIYELKYQYYTPNIHQEFPIDAEGIINLAKENLTLESFVDVLGIPNSTNYMGTTRQVQYTWASNADPEISSIQLYYNIESGSYELYYVPTE